MTGKEKEGAYGPQKRRKWERKGGKYFDQDKIFGMPGRKKWRRKEWKILEQEKIFGGKRNHTTKLSSWITLLKRLRKLIEKDC